MKKKRFVIFGAGGFAREVAWLIREIDSGADQWDFAGYVVSDPSKLGVHDSVEQVRGGYEWLDDHVSTIDAAFIGIGNPAVRVRLSEELPARFPTLEWPWLMHPSVVIDSASLQIGRGALVCAGVVGTVNVAIEPFALEHISKKAKARSTSGSGSDLREEWTSLTSNGPTSPSTCPRRGVEAEAGRHATRATS